MRKLLLTAFVSLPAAMASAQDVPHDFKQDTPPVPGQIVETQREKLQPGPRLYRAPPAHDPALPSSGPKATAPAPQPDKAQPDGGSAH
jgi:hypothetical protein